MRELGRPRVSFRRTEGRKQFMPWSQWAEGENSGHGDFSRAGLAAEEQTCGEETGATKEMLSLPIQERKLFGELE